MQDAQLELHGLLNLLNHQGKCQVQDNTRRRTWEASKKKAFEANAS